MARDIRPGLEAAEERPWEPLDPKKVAAVHAEVREWRREQIAKGGKLIGGVWVYPESDNEAKGQV